MDDQCQIPADLALRFRERVRTFAARRIGDPAEAGAIVDETLRRVHAALQRRGVDGGAADIASFVFATAGLVCDVRARRRRAKAADEAEQPVGTLTKLVDPERRAAIAENWRSLTGREKKLLKMFYGDGMTVRDIAALLGLGPEAVRTMRVRALQRLAGTGEPIDLAPLDATGEPIDAALDAAPVDAPPDASETGTSNSPEPTRNSQDADETVLVEEHADSEHR